MGNVAMNLVATMMQNNFSSSYVSQSPTSSSGNFSGVFQSVKSNRIEPSEQSTSKKVKSYNLSDTSAKADKAGSSYSDKPVKPETQTVKHTEDNKQVHHDDKQVEHDDKQVEHDDKVSNNGKVSKKRVDKTSDLTEEQVDAVNKSLEEVVNKIADVLNMDVNQVKQLLDQLNLTVADMFNMDNLKLLLTKGSKLNSPIELLTTEGAMDGLTEIVSKLKEVSGENPLVAQWQNSQQNSGGQEQNNEADLLQNPELFQTQAAEVSADSSTGEGSVNLKYTSSEQSQALNTNNDNAAAFENVLNQVVTQKTQTLVMNGEIRTIQTEVTAKDVFDQIVTGMKVKVTDTSSKVLLQLNPQNLGKIGVNLTNENGTITGHFVAETEAVKEMIEANLASLKTQLQNQGIDVSEIKITLGNTSQFLAGDDDRQTASNNNNNSKNKNRHNIGKISSAFADNISDESEEQEQAIRENSSIELHA